MCGSVARVFSICDQCDGRNLIADHAKLLMALEICRAVAPAIAGDIRSRIEVNREAWNKTQKQKAKRGEITVAGISPSGVVVDQP